MTPTILRRAALAGVALSALLTVAACGGADDAGGMTHDAGSAAPSASSSANATANDADVMFAQMMIPHHQQAVAMADLAPTRASDSELKNLAAKIKAAQDPEITTMKGWLTAWGKPTDLPSDHSMPGMSATPGHGMPGMDAGMPGMMSEQQMTDLAAAKGPAFDKMFAEMMIAHHKGAIDMARTEQADGSNPEAKALAAKIASDQAAEVQTLQKILDRL
ncbi:DUF305 domain-containing protein [Micromonospora sp. WMMB235]|uniref:DUF305 domain-containing protein n=1 Tax=Micromonospora sp. WMMB235 TaxID=1172030 RepID=UPI0008DA243F|nr:DUF305 domain-containing protein [Micromonospora sp. WMMB235]OHX01562.1 DUF305 domain-containing protein [Micromonospora sp. WMMB235]